MGQPNTPECEDSLAIMLSTCEWLGVPLKAEKLEGPSHVLMFLGIILDTQRRETRLPEKKLDELKALLSTWRLKKACRKCELLSLFGKLSDACKVVQPGQVFLRKLIDLSTKAKHPDYWVKLDAEFWVDLA